MQRDVTVNYRFVEFIPSDLEDDTVYVSVEYATAVHKCCCGCGNKVVTPLSTTDWKLTYDGESISLYPSIGNWSFDCQSHYWIRQNRVSWATRWSKQEIEDGREQDRLRKAAYFDVTESENLKAPRSERTEDRGLADRTVHAIKSWWARLIRR